VDLLQRLGLVHAVELAIQDGLPGAQRLLIAPAALVGAADLEHRARLVAHFHEQRL
jgi:hypothetical protein